MAGFEPILYVYGPPGSGKTTVGQRLAEALALPFCDLDDRIVAAAGCSIPEIFASEGEAGFRAREAAALNEAAAGKPQVVSLGGGALLNPACRLTAESSGVVVCLSATVPLLAERLEGAAGTRPLLGGRLEQEARLAALMEARRAHYGSFPLQFDAHHTPDEIVWAISVRLGLFHVTGMGRGYDVRILPGGLDHLGELMKNRGLGGPVALVTDEHTAPLYAGRARAALEAAGYRVHAVSLPAGEASKTLASAAKLWEEFLAGGLERGSTAVALGGGVIGDLVGFAASAYLRGMRWVAAPTSLLAMVDAGLGGKTAIDLPQGKNLIGAFHPPALVLSDPEVLASLPEPELRNGLAEVAKHGLLRDPALFAECAQGWEALQGGDWTGLVRRGAAVKVRYILADPYEHGERAALNLGHTIGHAVESASQFRLRHGEAVSIGLVAAARLGVRTGLCSPALVEEIQVALHELGLPISLPDWIDPAQVLPLLQLDKKKRGGQVRFVLPIKVGEVRHGVALDLDLDTLIEVTR